ncbi:hypothetical protein [Eubacterium barkeri]|uniref:Uncharacterized protein n=1 Tax=Eubacterium barkeri TaxID=1528 RepID=A0A1H3IRC3_EUBBA|nr:hypothetical protein [Eubacterium barkeri]SDY30252.1 hypothetical protein SAMN04488579_12451 [Eubacterium barkeri]
MNCELKALTQRLIDCSKEARSLNAIDLDDVRIIGLASDFTVHVSHGIEVLADFFCEELKERDREDSFYNREAYFDVDGVEFFELRQETDEEYD